MTYRLPTGSRVNLGLPIIRVYAGNTDVLPVNLTVEIAITPGTDAPLDTDWQAATWDAALGDDGGWTRYVKTDGSDGALARGTYTWWQRVKDGPEWFVSTDTLVVT